MIAISILAMIILAAALASTRLARPVPAALALALALAMIGVMQIVLGAAFIGLVQFMVYVGAVAILIIFALLVTKPDDEPEERASRRAAWPVILIAAVPAGLVIASLVPGLARRPATTGEAPALPLAEMGKILFTTHAVAVLAVAVLLTAVLIGAALIAREPNEGKDGQP